MPNDMSPLALQRDFSLTGYLEGRTRAWGIFEDRFGRVRSRFDVSMFGQWQGDTFTLNEEFIYDSGRTETRVWTVIPGPENTFRATCDDCVGEATGFAGDDEVTMSYVFRLKLQSRELHVCFTDRLIKIDDFRAVNRAIMSKWGVRLGELSLFFERDNHAEQDDLIAL
ncbi:MAG: DUF3833 family protein [Hyphomicrobiaceae bacterium]